LTYRFAAGVAAGNLSEIGIGWAATGDTLFSRALILDGSGSPTNITVDSDEIFDATYELRLYPPVTDVTGTITLDGNDYDYIIRAANVDGYGSAFIGGSWGNPYTTNNQSAYSGAIGAITELPSGTAQVSTSHTGSSTASGEFTGTVTWGIATGNFAGGIESVVLIHGISGVVLLWAFQIDFDPAIPKDNTMELSLTYKYNWARV
jgi:hypothetical protein